MSFFKKKQKESWDWREQMDAGLIKIKLELWLGWSRNISSLLLMKARRVFEWRLFQLVGDAYSDMPEEKQIQFLREVLRQDFSSLVEAIEANELKSMMDIAVFLERSKFDWMSKYFPSEASQESNEVQEQTSLDQTSLEQLLDVLQNCNELSETKKQAIKTLLTE